MNSRDSVTRGPPEVQDSSCPDQTTLANFCLGVVSRDEWDALSAHVTTCVNCGSTLRQFERQSDAVIGALRHRRTSGETGEVGCPSLVQRVEDIPQRIRDEFKAGSGKESAGAPALVPLERIGQYQLLQRLGGGGMGVVYKALHVALGKTVALKVLSAHRTGIPEAVGRFQREMKAVGKLQHPNIVTAHDAGEANGVHYLTMEFVEGDDLAALIKKHGPLLIPDACELARQAAVGLAHIHQHGLVHRDIKPSNLMLTKEGQVKILDLGLALLDVESTADGPANTASQAGLGTADFIAPEQISDAHSVDIRADIYSLGCTLYQLLSGRTPFSGQHYATPMQKAFGHSHHAPPPLAGKRQDIPLQLAATVERMLAKDPQCRYAKPPDVVEALAPFTLGANLTALMTAPRTDAAVEREDTDGSLHTTETYLQGSGLEASRLVARKEKRIAWYVAVAAAVALLVAAGYWVSGLARQSQNLNEPQNPDITSVVGITVADSTAGHDLERETAQWILESGGWVSVSLTAERMTAGVKSMEKLPPQPFTIYSIYLQDRRNTSNDDLARLRNLSRLGILDLSNTAITDDGLRHLEGLTNLNNLNLAGTQVSDRGLPHLARLALLIRLDLKGTQVTAEGVQTLQEALRKCVIQR